jgi:methionyl-tRNA formyltransferase
MAVRVIFFGNSLSTFSARHFAALLDVPGELVGVVDVPATKQNTTNPLAAAGLLNFVDEARKRNIPAYQPSDPNTSSFASELAKLEADLFLAAGYAIILKEVILELPKLLAVNFHASLLPAYRGKHPVFWALRSGEKLSGMTVHAMDPGIDTGDIIYQVRIRTRQDDTVATMYKRIMDQSMDFVRKLIADAEHNRIPRQPQPKNTGSYFSSTTEDDFQLDWTWSAEKIKLFITITPGKCFAIVGGGKVYFFNAQKEVGVTTYSPGTLQNIRKTRATVATGSGVLSSSLIQIEGGEPESFAGFCRREGFHPGDSLTG